MTRLLASSLLAALLVVPAAGAQTAAPSAGALQPAAPAAGQNEYLVGAQDVLKISVFDEPTMSGSYRVDSDGSFQYPMLGRVPAAGLKPRDIAQLLKGRLEDGYINRAQVTVDVEQFRSRSIFVVGEVRAPGKYPFAGNMTLIEALAAAGSTTASASTEVLILRPRQAGTEPVLPDQASQANVSRVSLANLQLGRLSENVSLQEGDTIFVPKSERFFITGQVKSPGAYTYERGLTVLQALALAGGLTDKGSDRRMKVIRTVNGKKVEQGIKLDDTIQPGDTLVIQQRLL